MCGDNILVMMTIISIIMGVVGTIGMMIYLDNENKLSIKNICRLVVCVLLLAGGTSGILSVIESIF